jgi:3-methyladenine DNA glycosylase AlkD
MTALLILVEQFKRGGMEHRQRVYDLYLRNTAWINNWDLVDASAEYIVGPWLEGRADQMAVLTRLAQSRSVWERRIAMLATFHDIKQKDPAAGFAVAELLLRDKHDLIQKAVGWMLREIGKRCSLEAEELFLQEHYQRMARTTLRYAIERFPPEKRVAYLAGAIK